MNIPLLLRTVRHLRPTQVAHQVMYRLHKAKYRPTAAPDTVREVSGWTEWIAKGRSLIGDGSLRFLNISDAFAGWNSMEHGALWAYNLNYMDWLCQEDMTFELGAQWIDRFIDDLPSNSIGLDPYPIALRGINWVKFICLHATEIDPARRKRWDDSLYGQYRLLERKLEFHLLGNHLLEDAFSLFIGSVYFRDRGLHEKACALLRRELREQILSDGAHYEQSPMYHCIMLDRLLDCLSMARHAEEIDGLAEMAALLTDKAALMLGHLESICYGDGSYPLFGDSAHGIAPTPRQLFDYARRLGVAWNPIPMGACGYRHLVAEGMEALVDVGNIMATYQPGHSHADTLSFELRIDGKPFIVDTGISTYNKTLRRQYERSTEAHNTVTVEGCGDSNEVWGGFRVGRRTKVTLLRDEEMTVIASHDGYAPAVHERSFKMTADGFIIEDIVKVTEHAAHCRLHLSKDAMVISCDLQRIDTDCADILIEGAEEVKTCSYRYSEEYNEFEQSTFLDITFREKLKITIIKKER